METGGCWLGFVLHPSRPGLDGRQVLEAKTLKAWNHYRAGMGPVQADKQDFKSEAQAGISFIHLTMIYQVAVNHQGLFQTVGTLQWNKGPWHWRGIHSSGRKPAIHNKHDKWLSAIESWKLRNAVGQGHMWGVWVFVLNRGAERVLIRGVTWMKDWKDRRTSAMWVWGAGHCKRMEGLIQRP